MALLFGLRCGSVTYVGIIICINNILFMNLYLPLQWYVSTLTVPKSILLIINSINANIRPWLKLTSQLLVETLSHLDYVVVYVANANCTDNIVSANSSQRQLIEKCIDTKLHMNLFSINVSAACKEFIRYLAMVLCMYSIVSI